MIGSISLTSNPGMAMKNGVVPEGAYCPGGNLSALENRSAVQSMNARSLALTWRLGG